MTATATAPRENRTPAVRHEAAREIVASMAHKHARGDKVTESEDAALDRALLTLQMTEDDFADAIGAAQAYEAGKGEKAKARLNAAGRDLAKARQAVSEYQRETERIAQERNAQMFVLRKHLSSVESDLAERQRDYDVAQAVADETPWLFGSAPADLDCYTLRSGQTVCNLGDPRASVRAVSQEVMTRESARRHELVREATRAAMADHQAATREHAAKYKYADKPPKEPEFIAPTWADVLKSMGKVSKTDER